LEFGEEVVDGFSRRDGGVERDHVKTKRIVVVLALLCGEVVEVFQELVAVVEVGWDVFQERVQDMGEEH